MNALPVQKAYKFSICSFGLVVMTAHFECTNTGSNPVRGFFTLEAQTVTRVKYILDGLLCNSCNIRAVGVMVSRLHWEEKNEGSSPSRLVVFFCGPKS
jgi:hypothetical protein